jgi:uncharacterized membrane protein
LQVPKGTNGALSPLGTAASLGGGLFLGLVFFISSALFCVEPTSAPQWPVILVGGFAGFVGSLVLRLCSSTSSGAIACFIRWRRRAGAHQPNHQLDSLLGATLQYSGFCSRQQKVVSQPGPTVKHLTGADLLTNGQVQASHHFFFVDLTPHASPHTRTPLAQVNFVSALLTAPLTAAVTYAVMA